MTKELEQLREGLAENDNLKHKLGIEVFKGFKRGFNALLSHLERAAGEFDEVATFQIAAKKYKSVASQIFIEGARWQFEQDRARIGLAESRLESVKHCFDDAQSQCVELIEENSQLEARLAESEQQLTESTERFVNLRSDWLEARDKLTAAEARCKELEAALEWIAGVDESKPYCTYYERTLEDGSTVPTTSEIAAEALKAAGIKI